MNTFSNFPIFEVYVKGAAVEFTSAFRTLEEAKEYLAANLTSGQSFARDLLAKRNLSGLQVAWVHKLATDRATPRTDAPAAAAAGLNLRPVLDLLDRAAVAGKKFPQLVVPAPTSTGTVQIKRVNAGDRTGTAVITTGAPFGTPGSFLGRVDRAGAFTATRSAPADLVETLRALAADPQRVCAQHGVATGQCCYCGRPLSTKESRSVGYGPTCAEKFGLPWGAVSAAVVEADAAAKQVDLLPPGYVLQITELPKKADPRLPTIDGLIQADAEAHPTHQSLDELAAFRGRGFTAREWAGPEPKKPALAYEPPPRADLNNRYYPYSGYGPNRAGD